MAQRGLLCLYCLGCGSDLSITPIGRRDIGVNSLASPAHRGKNGGSGNKRILMLWTALMRQELSCKNIIPVYEGHYNTPLEIFQCFVPQSSGSNSSRISNVHFDQSLCTVLL